MAEIPPPNVLVVMAAGAARVAAALAGFGNFHRDFKAVPPDARIDVLITDSAEPPNLPSVSGPASHRDDEKCLPLNVPILAIGPAPKSWADLTLPEDCTARELRTACTLLVEIGRLRLRCTRIADSRSRVRKLALADPLTGLANRRAWEARLAERGTATGSTRLCLAILDLDQFKQINDQRGMTVGDRVLKRVAAALADCVGAHDLIARLGGDEFGVLLADPDTSAACDGLDRLRAAVAAVEAPDAVGSLTASIGYAVSEGGFDPAALFATAERGLREAKRAGGDRICRGDSRSGDPSLDTRPKREQG